MATLCCIGSRTSEDNPLCDPNLCLHHHLQHYLSSTPNLLSSARKSNEHPLDKLLQHPSCLSPIHPLLTPHNSSPHLRNRIRPPRAQTNRPRIRHHSSPTRRRRALLRNILHGRRRARREEEKRSLVGRKQPSFHLLDHTSVPNLWDF